MGLIGINSVQEGPRKPTTLEEVAQGVQIAAGILGSGMQLYNTFGPPGQLTREQQTQSIAASKAQMQNEKTASTLNQLQNGIVPVDQTMPSTYGKPYSDLSEDELANENAKMRSSGLPGLTRLGDGKVYAQLWQPMSPLQKSIFELNTNGRQIVPANSPKAMPTYMGPGSPPIYTAPKELDTQQKASVQNQDSDAFKHDAAVEHYEPINQAAAYAQSILMKQQRGEPITNPDNIALSQAVIKSMAPNARFNVDGTMDLSQYAGSQRDKLQENLKNLGIFGNQNDGRMDANVRSNLIKNIALQEQTARKPYMDAVQFYTDRAHEHGVSLGAPVLAPPVFPSFATQTNPNPLPSIQSPQQASPQIKPMGSPAAPNQPAPRLQQMNSFINNFGGQGQ